MQSACFSSIFVVVGRIAPSPVFWSADETSSAEGRSLPPPQPATASSTLVASTAPNLRICPRFRQSPPSKVPRRTAARSGSDQPVLEGVRRRGGPRPHPDLAEDVAE